MYKVILCLSFIIATRFFGLFILLPVVSVYGRDLANANDFLIGLLAGIYALSQMLLQIPFGALSDKIGRKKTLFIGLFIFILGSLICANTDDIYVMIVGRLIQGAGAIGAVGVAMISDFVPEESRSKAMAVMGVFIGLSFAASLVISPVLSAYFNNLACLFYLSALVTLLCMALLLFLPKEEQIISQSAKSPLKILLLDKNLALMNLSNFLQKMLLSVSFLVIPVILLELLHFDKAKLYAVYAVAMLGGFLAMGVSGALGDKRGLAKNLLLIGIVLFIISYVAFVNLPFVLLFSDYALFYFIAAVVLFFIAFNLHEPVLQSTASKFVKVAQRGEALGIFNSFGYAGSLVGGLIAGLFFREFFLTSFCVLILAMGLWFVSMCYLKNPKDFAFLSVNLQSDISKIANLTGIVEISKHKNAYLVKFDSKLISKEELETKL